MESHTLNGAAARDLRSPALARLVRRPGKTSGVSRCRLPRSSASSLPRMDCSFSKSIRRLPTSASPDRITSTWKPRPYRKA